MTERVIKILGVQMLYTYRYHDQSLYPSLCMCGVKNLKKLTTLTAVHAHALNYALSAADGCSNHWNIRRAVSPNNLCTPLLLHTSSYKLQRVIIMWSQVNCRWNQSHSDAHASSCWRLTAHEDTAPGWRTLVKLLPCL